MSIRLAALALAAAMTVATGARAQGFFEFYDLSPRQIAGMLADEGYEINGPMLRRGDVYVCNALSITGRPMRLIVDAHRGRVLERFAISEGRRYGDGSYDRRASRDDGESWPDEERPGRRHDQVALGDPGSPHSQGDDADDPSWAKLTPPDVVPEATPKPKRHAIKKHREPAAATAPATALTPSAEPTPVTEAPKPAASPSVAAVAPSAPAETTKPPVRVIKLTPASPEAAKPATEAAKPPQAPEVAKPTPEPSMAAQTRPTVEAGKSPPAEKPKPEGQKKKINDLPVGTLD